MNTVVAPAITWLSVPGLDGNEQATLNALLAQLGAKQARQRDRQMYYDQKFMLKDLGIALPPSLSMIDAVLGWPAKAVDHLASRQKFEQFVIPGGTAEDFGIDTLMADNNMDIEVPQLVRSTLLHACSFVAVTKGDVQSGEPEVLISPRSGLSGTGIWSRRLRRLTSALAVTDVDDYGNYTGLIVYLGDRVLILTKFLDRWTVDRRPHSLGRPPVIPVVHRPDLDRPFGRSG